MVTPRALTAALLPLLLAGCGAGPQATLSQSTLSQAAVSQAAVSQAAAPVIPPDLAPLKPLHADRILVAGESVDLTTSTGVVRVKVNGPATGKGTLFGSRSAGALHHYLATFTVTITPVRGTTTVSPADFRLLAIADQVDGGEVVTHEGTAATLPTGRVTRPVVGTWSAPFVEGHGELLYTPTGATRPAALWDFRVEA